MEFTTPGDDNPLGLRLGAPSPGAFIKPDRGPTNMRVRGHLGIEIPDGRRWLKVGGDTPRWREGRRLVFDDSFAPEAWKATPGSRILLIVDFRHPRA